jgi:hypothetical protein
MKMNIFTRLIIPIAIVALTTVACGNRKNNSTMSLSEDLTAKKMLQGVWLDEDEEDPAFRVVGDTIFYPDSTSQPVYFQIVKDTLILHGSNTVKYQILKQAPHFFMFKNQNGDVIKLAKTSDRSYLTFFGAKRPAALNQNRLIKRDSVVIYGKDHYHWYVQVNPTTYKVVKPTYNDDGVEVDNVYFDNIIHLGLFRGATQIYSHDIHKGDFKNQVPDQALSQSILSDIVYAGASTDGFHFNASLCIPDSPTSYQIIIVIGFNGSVKYKTQ